MFVLLPPLSTLVKSNMICHHCQKDRYPAYRQLCWRCYLNSKIRKRYAKKKTGNSDYFRGKDFYGLAMPPSTPTPYPPGSKEKLEVMAERASRLEQLHHPADGHCNGLKK